nr:reverse transcriptase domain-containing protein [Tanacetum cinerariifolium]
MAGNHTMEELLQAPTERYREAIVILEINADHFEIKTNLLQLVQANPYHGFERKNPHTHINNFKRITLTLKFRDVPNDVIKLMMFPYSLEGSAGIWCDKEPPNSILTWEDLEMLRACPHYGFTKLVQIDTFYNGLNDNDQDTLNATAGGNILSKTTRKALQIIDNKSNVHFSRNKPNVSRMNTTSRENANKTDDRIDKLADQILTLVDFFAKKVVTPAPVKVVEESFVTCGGPHAYYNCPNTNSNQPGVCVATGTYNQVAPQNRASNYMAPPGFASNQSSTSGTLPGNTIPNPKGEMKGITTQSGVAYEGPSIPTPKEVAEQETEETIDKEQTNFQGSVRSFLGHADFYRRFIQDFSKIARPMTHLLEKKTSFMFSKDFIDAFETLKKKLTEASILVVPDWNLPFELMCDASDFEIGVVLGQRKTKHFQPIHYASKTMTVDV